jgi:hypothetical protein
MSACLNELIEALEREAAEEQDRLRRLEGVKGYLPKDASGTLKRTLQRIEVLRALRKTLPSIDVSKTPPLKNASRPRRKPTTVAHA